MKPRFEADYGYIYLGNALDVLKEMPSESVHCCVTSPPYWGLRDYGVDGQIGLEPSPEEYVSKMVEVFREVRRVLRDDGTLWLNLGDSYAAGSRDFNSFRRDRAHVAVPAVKTPPGLKPKDLVGVPWMVAKALRDPYYTGTIKRVEDRIWLAAMIDGEGCMFIHKRKAGSPAYSKFRKKDGAEVEYNRTADTYGAGLEVANCHEEIVKRCLEITGMGSICSQGPEQNARRKQQIFRWNLRTNACRDIIREVYPYLVGKKHEARLLIGCPSSGEQAHAAHEALKILHNGGFTDVDFPEPKSMHEEGFYLRQDIIWAKKNCMPESVTDRCTKSHEYLFLMSKSWRYYYDAGAIKEESVYPNDDRVSRSNESQKRMPTELHAGIRPRIKSRLDGILGQVLHGTIHRDGRAQAQEYTNNCYPKRNKRSVWTVATQPFSGAHFATFPPSLIEPCVLAGCPVGGTVLDPFFGAGTTGVVSYKLDRKFIGIELSQKYLDEIAIPRIKAEAAQLKLFASGT
jgi:DNA modification methylase